jgi:hypothetical protein
MPSLAQVLTQSASEIGKAAMNVKSCLKVHNGLLYRTVCLKLEEAKVIYYAKRAAPRGHCGASVARQFLCVRTDGVVP